MKPSVPGTKFNISMTMNEEVYNAAKAYAAEKHISFSRLIHEVLIVAVGETLSPEIRARVEARIIAHPGRRAMTPEELAEREERRAREVAERKRAKLEAQLKRLESERTVVGGKIVEE